MPPRPRWSEEELAALSRLKPYDQRGMRLFLARYPHHSREAAQARLMKLRIAGRAADVVLPAPRPFPAYRFD